MGAKGIRAALAAVGACVALAASGGAAADTAGSFQFVAGDVRLIVAGGAERPARKGTPLATGDTVVTARGSTAQIKMGDGAIVVVQPESRLTVVEFRYSGSEDGSEKVVYRLDQGGFRAITGAIGRRHKENYLIQTPIAQMGVRGTDHESYYLRDGAATGIPAGVYNKVNVGAVYIRTRAGEVVVGPSQAGYAASALDAPRLLPEIPAFFNRAVPPRLALIYPARERAPATAPVEQTVDTSGGLNLSNPAAGLGSGSSSGSGSGSGMGTGSTVAYLQAGGANANSGMNLAIVPNGATIANAGGDAAFGVNWGTWQGGSPAVAGIDADPKAGVNFASSTQLTTAAQLAALPPGLVSATYNYPGLGGAVTNQDGVAGKINSLTVGVNFSNQTITSYSVNASAGGATWTANATGTNTLAQFGSSSGISLNGSCDCASANVKGSASGALVGPAAERMITSFGLKANATNAISGAALLSR